ncbi:MAG TPA: hypothetical protein VIH16_06745 [Bellilinea sp.]
MDPSIGRNNIRSGYYTGLTVFASPFFHEITGITLAAIGIVFRLLAARTA